MGNTCCKKSKPEYVNEVYLLKKKDKVIVKSDFASPEANTIFRKSERLKVVNKVNDDWYCVKKNGKEGYIPENYIVPKYNVANKPWYFGHITRLEAKNKLKTPTTKDGVFLIRRPYSAKDCEFILDVKYSIGREPLVAHYKIHRNLNGYFYIAEECAFETINSLIQFYKKETEQLCTRLTRPCKMHDEEEPVQFDLHPVYTQNLEIPKSEFELFNTIGEGHYGVVYRAKFRHVRNVAIKVLKFDCNLEMHLKEIEVMKLLRHQNLIALYGICTESKPIFMVQEYVKHGCIKDYLKRHNVEPDILLFFAFQVSDAMEYLHSKMIIHCDLAARNVLLGEKLKIKVCDFGLARMVDSDIYKIKNHSISLPIKWTAPEVYINDCFCLKSDVWSFGILLYEFYSKCGNPYQGIPCSKILSFLHSDKRLDKPNSMPSNIYEIALDCWKWNSDERPNFVELKKQFGNLLPTNSE